MSYLYGSRLGAIDMGQPIEISLAAVAAAWALLLPGVVWLAHQRSVGEVESYRRDLSRGRPADLRPEVLPR
jgi:hypothetical protein